MPSEVRKAANSPNAQDVFVDELLTNFSQQYRQRRGNFVARQAFVNHPVTIQSGLYPLWSLDDLNRIEVARRTEGTLPMEAGFTVDRGRYDCIQYALSKPVTDETVQNAGPLLRRPYLAATGYITDQFMIHTEDIMADTVMTTTAWPADNREALSGASQWTNAASNPITAIRQAKRQVQLSSKAGIIPNSLLLGREAYDALLDNGNILDRIKGGASVERPALVMRQLLAAILELEAVYVSDAVKTTSKKGQTSQTTARVVSDNALLYYNNPNAGIDDPVTAAFFNWSLYPTQGNGDALIERTRGEPRAKTDFVTGYAAYDFKIVSNSLGFYFSDVAA